MSFLAESPHLWLRNLLPIPQLTLNVDKTSGMNGDTFYLSGTFHVIPPPTGGTVELWIVGGSIIGTATLDGSGNYGTTWTSNIVGQVSIEAHIIFRGINIVSNRVTITVTEYTPPATITLNVDKTTGYRGETFTFSGHLARRDATPIGNHAVDIVKYDLQAVLVSGTTNDNGDFTIPWVADGTGDFDMVARATITGLDIFSLHSGVRIKGYPIVIPHWAVSIGPLVAGAIILGATKIRR